MSPGNKDKFKKDFEIIYSIPLFLIILLKQSILPFLSLIQQMVAVYLHSSLSSRHSLSKTTISGEQQSFGKYVQSY